MADENVTAYKVTGDFRHVIEDGIVDLDALPDAVLPSGFVEFVPVTPSPVVAGAPPRAYTLGPYKGLIVAGRLEDLQGRDGVMLTGEIGTHVIRWQARTTLEFRGQAIPYPDVVFDLTEDAQLTGIIYNPVPGDYPPVVVDPRFEALVQSAEARLAEIDEVVADAEGHAAAALAAAAGVAEDSEAATTAAASAAASSAAAGGHAATAESQKWEAVSARDATYWARDEAYVARDAAAGSAAAAGGSATAAAGSATNAGTARTAAEAARDVAVANALEWRGSWAAGTNYVARDMVTHGGSTWRALTSSTGVTPVEGASWTVVAAKGEPGSGGSSDWDSITGKPATFAPAAHTHSATEIGPSTGRSATTFLRGDNTWVVPTNTTYSAMTQTVAEAGSATTANTVSGAVLKGAIQRWVTGAYGTAVSAVGQALAAASDAAAARAAIGAGTSNLALGTTSSTAKAGDYAPAWGDVTSKPTTFAPTIGSTSTTAKAGDYVPAWGDVTGKPSTFAPTIGATSSTAVAGNDSRLTAMSQAEAEAGVSTTARVASPAVVKAAITAHAGAKVSIGALPTTGVAGVLYVVP